MRAVRVQTPLLPEAGKRARVTVLVPCYNYGRFLRASVCSALTQTDVDVDVVIVDDASTDDSKDVAEALAAEDPRVRVVAHTRNQGHVETYNAALKLAHGDYIVKLDADDLLTAGSLARSTALMEANPSVALCYGRPVTFDGEPPSVQPTPTRRWMIWDGRHWVERVLRRGHNVIMQPEVLLRREAVVASGGYRPALRWAEDYNWWLRLAWWGDVGWISGPAQGMYRVHDGSLQRAAADVELTDLRARFEAVRLFFEENPDAEAQLADVAFEALGRNAQELTSAALRRPGGGAEASREFSAIAHEIEATLGRPLVRRLAARPGPVGELARRTQWRLRLRRWDRTGV